MTAEANVRGKKAQTSPNKGKHSGSVVMETTNTNETQLAKPTAN